MSNNNAAFGLPIEMLNVVVVEPSKPMQTIMRSVLSGIKVARVRIFDSVHDALRSMHSEHPHVVLTDLMMQPTSGVELIKLMRRPDMDPLCYVPIIVVTAQASRSMLAQSIQAGAHHVLAKPVSPAIIQKTLRWISRDARVISQEGDRYIISGIEEVVSQLSNAPSMNGVSTSGDEQGLKFHKMANNGAGSQNNGLKFQREDAIDGSSDDSLKFSKIDNKEQDDGLKFTKETSNQGEQTQTISQEELSASNSESEKRVSTETEKAQPTSNEPAAPPRKRRAFAALAR